MPEGHKNYHDYANELAPRLDRHIDQLRDRVFEGLLGEAVMLFSFTLENMESKAQRHGDILTMIGVIPVAMNDVLRGLQAGQANLSPMTVAALTRIALELRAYVLFIISRKDPKLYADRYSRFRDVETLLH